MTNIVARLRTFDAWEKVIARFRLTKDAADEIERLRAAIRMMVRLDKCASPDVYRVAREALGDE